MAGNLKLRVWAQQAFLRSQAQDQVPRALNLKTRLFVPRDLVFFKRIRPPAQPLASTRMSHKLWRWYGPGLMLSGRREETITCDLDGATWPSQTLRS